MRIYNEYNTNCGDWVGGEFYRCGVEFAKPKEELEILFFWRNSVNHNCLHFDYLWRLSLAGAGVYGW